MIQCTHCGTKNRDGSKYCSDCGARLVPQAGLVCPMCSTPNPVENVFCSKCGARLVPLTAATITDKPAAPAPIKGISLPSKPAEPPAPPPPSAKTEDWLEQLRTQIPDQPTDEPSPAEPPTHEETEGIPDWLARLRAAEPPPDELSPGEKARQAAAAIQIGDEEVPDWLRPAPAETESPRVADTARMPDWVLEVPAAQAAPSSAAPTPSAQEPDTAEPQVPAWFKPSEPSPDLPPPVPATEDEIPEWLKALKPSDEALRAPAPPLPSETLVEGIPAEKPAWLTTTPYTDISEDEFLPDWLRTPIPPQPTPTTPEGVAPEFRGELPDWIAALKPAEAAIPHIVETGPVETTGPLAGLRSVLPLAAVIAEPHRLSPAPDKPPAEHARLFEAIVAAPVAAHPPRARESTRGNTLFRALVYILLTLAIVIPFFVPDLANTSIRTFGTPTADLYDTVATLPFDSLVVLAFDYDPGSSGEMEVQANVLVRHLMQRRTRIVAISTLETGPQIAQRVLDTAARATGHYVYGTDYVNLGYLAGHEAGLRQLALAGFAPTTIDYVQRRPLTQYPNLSAVQSWRNVALVIELAGTPEVLQKWMEQVQPRAGVKIVAAVSAAAEPRARAYREAKQLQAFMSGLMGAAQYEILSNQRGLAVISVGAQSTASVVLIALIIMGNLFWLSSRNRGKTK